MAGHQVPCLLLYIFHSNCISAGSSAVHCLAGTLYADSLVRVVGGESWRIMFTLCLKEHNMSFRRVPRKLHHSYI